MLGVAESYIVCYMERKEAGWNGSDRIHTVTCADGIGRSGFIKCGEFLDYLRNYKLHKIGSAESYQLHNCGEGNVYISNSQPGYREHFLGVPRDLEKKM
jgi:hypothetical protein